MWCKRNFKNKQSPYTLIVQKVKHVPKCPRKEEWRNQTQCIMGGREDDSGVRRKGGRVCQQSQPYVGRGGPQACSSLVYIVGSRPARTSSTVRGRK